MTAFTRSYESVEGEGCEGEGREGEGVERERAAGVVWEGAREGCPGIIGTPQATNMTLATPPTNAPFHLQGYGWHPLLVYTYQSNTWMIDDLDTFGVVVGEQLSVQSEREECAVPVAEHAAFATAIAEGNAARTLHFDAQTNHNYLMAMLTDVDGCVGNNHDSSVDICDAWNLRGLQHVRCVTRWPTRLRSSALLSAAKMMGNRRRLVHVKACLWRCGRRKCRP